MPEVRRRRVVDEDKPVSRRRDRARADEIDEDEEEDVDATERPVRARKATKRTTKKRATTRRRPEPEPEEDDEEDYDEEEEELDEEEEEEEPPPPRRKKAAATKKAAPARRRRAAPEEDEEDEEEEEPPRRRRSTTARKASGTTKKKAKTGPRPGISRGQKGAEEVARASGGGVTRLTLSQQPELVKVLEPEPFCSFMQHWISSGPGQGDRPYVCLRVDCPLCEIGDSPNKTHLFNILHLSGDAEPSNKVLQIGVKAFKAFVSAATPRGKERPIYDRDYWAISRSGKDQQSQTNFQRIKDEDLDEDWDEIFEYIGDAEIEDLVVEAQDHLFDDSIVQTHTAKQLRELARYAADDDDEE